MDTISKFSENYFSNIFLVTIASEVHLFPSRTQKLSHSTRADFAEIYYEKAKTTTYRLSDSKLDAINNVNSLGIGIRIIKGDECYYTSTNNLNKDNIKEIETEIIVIRGH